MLNIRQIYNKLHRDLLYLCCCKIIYVESGFLVGGGKGSI